MDDKTIKPIGETLDGMKRDLPRHLRFKDIGTPTKEVTFNEWKDTIKNNFPDLIFASEIGLGIIAQILIKDVTNPFALVLVDVPSAGKTIAVNFFSDIEGLTYATDKFTPASFVSNASNVKKEDLKNIDLLPRLQYKLFIIRDLATLFSQRDDGLNECLGILTRVLDGEGLSTDSGNHGQREYKGEYLFMILAASTPIPQKIWKMMGSLGSRLFFLGINSKDKSEQDLINQLTTSAYKEKEKICRLATSNFLKTLWSKYPDGIVWDKEKDSSEIKTLIVRCAMLLARLRGVIQVHTQDDFGSFGSTHVHTIPVIEKPDRINQLFYNLCRGHALACGRTNIDKVDLKSIIELTIDSAPPTRAKLFRKLIEYKGSMKTSEIEKELECSKPTALKEMETLKLLKICRIISQSYGQVGEPEQEIHIVESLKWFVSDECNEIRNKSNADTEAKTLY